MSVRGSAPRTASLIIWLVGLMALAGAVVVVARNSDQARVAWDSVRASPTPLLLAALLLPVANLALSGLCLWLLTVRWGRVRYYEMLALVASAWLLNNLPLRPGMFGRIAYHRVVNQIPVRRSARVLVESVLGGAAAMGITVAALLAIRSGVPVAVSTELAFVALLTCSCALFAAGKDPSWRLCAVVAIRLVDIGVWTLRYLVVFRLVDAPIEPASAAAIALVVQAAMLLPIQLGLREWVVGLVSTLLPASVAAGSSVLSGSAAALTPGLTADLVNRVAEVVILLPIGAIGSLVLYRRWRAIERTRTQSVNPAAT